MECFDDIRKMRCDVVISEALVRGLRGLRFITFTRILCLSAGAVLCRANALEGSSSVTTLPIGTRLSFHLRDPISTDRNQTGQQFTFVLSNEVMLGGKTVLAAGRKGMGTLVVAGHSGMRGHEGDLTLELDSTCSADGRFVAFDHEKIEIDGKRRSNQASVLSHVPIVGIGAMLMRGSSMTIDPKQTINVVLQHDATISQVGCLPDNVEPAVVPADKF
jgi:hypothetical protein